MFARMRKRVTCRPIGAAKTEQKWRDRQDVNSIVARCLRGDNSGLRTCGINFVDVTALPDSLQECLNSKINADSVYDSLPPEARERWTTPAAFVKACSDENEKPYFKQFGLIKEAIPEPNPVKVEVINPPVVTPNGAA